MRVSLDSQVFTDARLYKLAQAAPAAAGSLDGRFWALGLLAHIWNHCYQQRSPLISGDLLEAIGGRPGIGQILIDCQLADYHMQSSLDNARESVYHMRGVHVRMHVQTPKSGELNTCMHMQEFGDTCMHMQNPALQRDIYTSTSISDQIRSDLRREDQSQSNAWLLPARCESSDPGSEKRPQLRAATADADRRRALIESIYVGYPRKDGKLRGMRRLARMSYAELQDVSRAEQHFVELMRLEGRPRQYIKQFDTFVNNYREYLAPEVIDVEARRETSRYDDPGAGYEVGFKL